MTSNDNDLQSTAVDSIDRVAEARRLTDVKIGAVSVDLGVNVVKAAFATTPFCGGIASLMSDYIPSARMRRLETFAQQVADDIRQIESRANEEFVKTDEFAFLFEECMRGASRHPQQEKLDAFRAIIVNSLIRSDVAQQEKEYFLNLVDNMTVVHMRLLQFMAQPTKFLEKNSIPIEKIRGGFSEFLPIAMSGLSVHLLRGAFADLHRFGLFNTDAGIFSSMTSAGGLKLVGDRVTPFGRQFLEFCWSPVK